MNGKLARAITATVVGLLVIGFIGNAIVSWRTLDVVENDLKHLESLMQETRQDVRELRAWLTGER